MSVTATIQSLPGNREAGTFLCLGFLTIVPVILLFGCGLFPFLALPVIYALPVVLVASVVTAVGVARASRSPVPTGIAAVGIVFLVGGAAFDISATLIHSPDLSREANPIARSLLDSGHSLVFVYAYAGIAQFLYIVLVCILWIGFLRHRHVLAGTLSDATTPLVFVKAATGGAHLTWRQWLCPLKPAELPRAYHLMWLLAALLFIGFADRWYLGLEWFQILPGWIWVVDVCSLVIGLAAYATWLWYASRDNRSAES